MLATEGNGSPGRHTADGTGCGLPNLPLWSDCLAESLVPKSAHCNVGRGPKEVLLQVTPSCSWLYA